MCSQAMAPTRLAGTASPPLAARTATPTSGASPGPRASANCPPSLPYPCLTTHRFHITAPFTVDAAGTYAFRFHTDFGRGGFMGVDDGLRFTPGDFWGHYQMAAAALTQGDHVFEALGFEGCCDGHAELELHLPCDGTSDPWRVVQAGASDCMSCAGGIGASFSAFKFNLDPAGDNTGLRNWAGANSINLPRSPCSTRRAMPSVTASPHQPGRQQPGRRAPRARLQRPDRERPQRLLRLRQLWPQVA